MMERTLNKTLLEEEVPKETVVENQGQPKTPTAEKIRNAAIMIALVMAISDEISQIMCNITLSHRVATVNENTMSLAAEKISSAFKDQHYVWLAGRMVFEPITGCFLSVPEPFYLDALLTLVKQFGMAFAFKITFDGPVKRHEWVIFYLITAYQVVILPVSVCGTIWMIFFKFGPFTSAWHHYLCYGFTFGETQYLANAVLLLGSMSTVLSVELIASEYVGHDIEEKALLARKKSTTAGIFFVSTLLVFLATAAPTMITNASVGSIVFCPILVPLLLAIMAVKTGWLWNPFSSESSVMQVSASEPISSAGADLINTGVDLGNVTFTSVFAVTLSLTYQLLVVLTTYWYIGYGWLGAWKITFLERQISVYGTYFVTGVLLKFAWCANFLNQIY